MENELIFTRLSAQGSPYEIGRRIGGLVQASPELRHINILEESVNAAAVRETQSLLRAFDPSVNEEIEGACDVLGIPKKRLAIFSDYSFRSGACSHFSALPPVTQAHGVLVGRSYEWTPDDELNLMVLRETGLPAHIGFSLFLFGRTDGLNERGFAVTMSSCEFLQPSTGKGLWFPLVLRILLDGCTAADDAVYLLKQLPLCCSVNILSADQGGGARLAEIACYGDDRRISFRSGEDWLVSANHYENADMKGFDRHHGYHSEVRFHAIEDALGRNRGEITAETLKTILGTKIPGGAACPYYADGLGTLRSMVMNLTTLETSVCFGSPLNQPWTDVRFDEPSGPLRFAVPYTNEFAENPKEFWRFIET